MTIGKRLKQVRKHFHLDKEQFSLLLGISGFELTLKENSLKSISCLELIDLNVLMGVCPIWLLYGEGNMLEDRELYKLRDKLIKTVFVDKEMNASLYNTLRSKIMESPIDVSLGE